MNYSSFVKKLLQTHLANGQQHYKRGLQYFKAADHGDYHDQEGLEKAIKEFEKAIKGGCKERDVFDRLTWSYLLLDRDNKKAEQVYTTGLTYYPEDVEFYFRRGDCRKELKRYKEAYNDYDKVIRLDTERRYKYFKDALYQRGAMRYILGDTINACKDREAAQRITDYELRTYDDFCRLWR